MANIFQKIFRQEYQWRLMDMVEEYDIKEELHSFNTEHITPCGHPVFGRGSKRIYSIAAGDTFIMATRNYDSTFNCPISVSLYVRRNRQGEDKRASEHTEKNTKFAYKMYGLMRDKYIAEREFGW